MGLTFSGEVEMGLKESVEEANNFVCQLEDELVDLINMYHIGNPRAEFIHKKVQGAKDALASIVVEKPKPKVTTKPETKTSKKTSFTPTKKY